MSGWHTALDKKVETVAWARNPQSLRYLHGFSKSLRENNSESKALAFMVATQDLDHHLARATPMYVHPDIMDIAEEAVQSFRTEPLRQTDVITPWMFMSLPRPIKILDGVGKTIAFSRISWHPVVVVDADDEKAERTRNGLSVLLWATSDDWQHDDYASEYWEMIAERQSTAELLRLSVLHGDLWMFDEEIPEYLQRIDSGGGYHHWLQVLMRLSMQQISQTQRLTAPRQSRRRASRYNLDDRDILVVKLRRSSVSSPHQESSIEHDHRWMVSGHWRNQWYPSLQDHRQIWIADHFKGPEDAPLRLHAGRAFELVH